MKLSAIALLAPVVAAHYTFDVTIYNGQTSSANQYIRASTRAVKYNPIKFSSNPPADIRDNSYIDGPDARCNQGAFSNAGSTSVLTVTAGSQLTVRVAYGAKMGHPGPTLVYMSRAPGDNVKAYDGSGDWFKIYQAGVCNQGGDFTKGAWCNYDGTTITATIPKNVPNGEYLVRFEHIGIHRSHINQPEHYVSCVQVKVQGGGNGTPGPMVKFPGAYRASDPYANFSIYGGYKSFTIPGPAVWDGAAGSGPAQPSPTPSGCSPLYAQCGGSGYTGPKCCSSGSCKVSNEWYSQCL